MLRDPLYEMSFSSSEVFRKGLGLRVWSLGVAWQAYPNPKPVCAVQELAHLGLQLDCSQRAVSGLLRGGVKGFK